MADNTLDNLAARIRDRLTTLRITDHQLRSDIETVFFVAFELEEHVAMFCPEVTTLHCGAPAYSEGAKAALDDGTDPYYASARAEERYHAAFPVDKHTRKDGQDEQE